MKNEMRRIDYPMLGQNQRSTLTMDDSATQRAILFLYMYKFMLFDDRVDDYSRLGLRRNGMIS